MSDEKIEAYQAAVLAAVLCAKMLAQHDLPALLQAIEHADAVGPIVDPTLWRDRHKAMHEDRELLRAALGLRKIGLKLQAENAAQQSAVYGPALCPECGGAAAGFIGATDRLCANLHRFTAPAEATS